VTTVLNPGTEASGVPSRSSSTNYIQAPHSSVRTAAVGLARWVAGHWADQTHIPCRELADQLFCTGKPRNMATVAPHAPQCGSESALCRMQRAPADWRQPGTSIADFGVAKYKAYSSKILRPFSALAGVPFGRPCAVESGLDQHPYPRMADWRDRRTPGLFCWLQLDALQCRRGKSREGHDGSPVRCVPLCRSAVLR
jgi:hypothetical protein